MTLSFTTPCRFDRYTRGKCDPILMNPFPLFGEEKIKEVTWKKSGN
jgi:hypothetical protein